MKMARTWAENSYCVRRQVGALMVKDNMIISDGFNGTPSGFENVCEDEERDLYDRCLDLRTVGRNQPTEANIS